MIIKSTLNNIITYIPSKNLYHGATKNTVCICDHPKKAVIIFKVVQTVLILLSQIWGPSWESLQ